MTAVRTRSRTSAATPRRAPSSRAASSRAASRSTASRSASARAGSGARTTNRSRSAVRSLPQETTGPRLQVLPRRRIGGRTLLWLSAALFFVVLAGAVTIQAQRIEAQHRIDRLDAALLEADELHRVLRAEVAVAESPEVVMQAAKDLGRVEPGPVLPLVPPVPEGPTPSTDPAPTDPSDAVDAGVALGAEGPDETTDEKVVAGGG